MHVAITRFIFSIPRSLRSPLYPRTVYEQPGTKHKKSRSGIPAFRGLRLDTAPQVVHTEPHYSRKDDVPERPREFAGNVFRISHRDNLQVHGPGRRPFPPARVDEMDVVILHRTDPFDRKIIGACLTL